MLQTLKDRFGIPGVIAMAALVFALAGGAYAATGGGGKATASAKAKKGPRGPKGPKGDTGPAGPQGPAGPAGAKGDAGAVGPVGPKGPTGPAGKAGSPGAPGADGEDGATGPTGATGPEGSPWVDGGNLPSGQIETGTWGYAGKGAGGLNVAPISFAIPLASPPTAELVQAPTQEERENEEWPSTANCGSFVAPQPVAGELCLYTRSELESSLFDLSSTFKGGALITFFAGEFANASGIWMVKAP